MSIIIKHWLPALALTSGLVWHFARRWSEDVEPSMIRNANEEILADMREMVRKREEIIASGQAVVAPADQPLTVADPDRLYWQLNYMRDKAGKIDRSLVTRGQTINAEAGRFRDVWYRPLRHELAAGTYVARSAGPDGVFDSPDDMTSAQARQRLTPAIRGKKPGGKKKKKKQTPQSAPATAQD